MNKAIKPPVRPSDTLFVHDRNFCLAVSLEGTRERVLFLRDDVQTSRFSGDVGFKVQRELKAGRDVFVFSGTVDGPVVRVSEAALHVRPAIVEATAKAIQTKPAALDARLEALARKAVTVTLDRLVEAAQARLEQARLDMPTEDEVLWHEGCQEVAQQKFTAAQLALDTLVARRDGLTQQAAPLTGEKAETPVVQTVDTSPDLDDADWGDYIDPDLLELTPTTEFM